MKIAIPTFGSRVSPRFDCAEAFLLIAVENGMVTARTELTATGGWAPHERINRLTESGVDTVLCGGIDCWSVASLQAAGVTVYASVAGEYEDALASLLRGELDASPPAGERGRRRCRRFLANDQGTDETLDQMPGQGRGCGQGRGQEGGRGCGRGQGGGIKKIVSTNQETSGPFVIAIPVASGQLCMHFGHCEHFALIDVDTTNKQILKTRQVEPPPHEPGLLPRWLHEQGANLIIAGGMGQRAQTIFDANGIVVIVGAPAGQPRDIAQSYLDGELESGTNACDH